jgi:hypothetical protein
MTIVGDSGEKRNCGSVDAAVEFISRRPHENFTIQGATDREIEEIRRRVQNVIKKE